MVGSAWIWSETERRAIFVCVFRTYHAGDRIDYHPERSTNCDWWGWSGRIDSNSTRRVSVNPGCFRLRPIEIGREFFGGSPIGWKRMTSDNWCRAFPATAPTPARSCLCPVVPEVENACMKSTLRSDGTQARVRSFNRAGIWIICNRGWLVGWAVGLIWPCCYFGCVWGVTCSPTSK